MADLFKTLIVIGLGDLFRNRAYPVLKQLKKEYKDFRVIGVDILENLPESLGDVVDKYVKINGRIPIDMVAPLKPGDVVYIATPPDFHLTQLFEVLCSGTGALVAVEKPLCWLQDYELAIRACDVLRKHAQSAVYVDHYTWIENFDQLLRDNVAPLEKVKRIDMALIDNPNGAPKHRFYTLQDGMIGDLASHHYGMLNKWLQHQRIEQYRLEVTEVIAASYLENGQPLPVKSEMAVKIRSKLVANGHTIDLNFRAGKGTRGVEKSAQFVLDDNTVLKYELDSRNAYFRILTSLLEQRTEGFLRLPDALQILGWMAEAKAQAVWKTPYNLGEMPEFLLPSHTHSSS